MLLVEAPLRFMLICAIISTVPLTVNWLLRNIDVLVNTVTFWADAQTTFLRKMVSCSSCLGFQLVMLFSTLICLVESFGLLSWILMCMCSMLLFVVVKPFVLKN